MLRTLNVPIDSMNAGPYPDTVQSAIGTPTPCGNRKEIGPGSPGFVEPINTRPRIDSDITPKG
jgi:hypothetical protein